MPTACCFEIKEIQHPIGHSTINNYYYKDIMMFSLSPGETSAQVA